MGLHDTKVTLKNLINTSWEVVQAIKRSKGGTDKRVNEGKQSVRQTESFSEWVFSKMQICLCSYLSPGC